MEVIELLRQSDFRYNKALGQNFITDKNLLNAITSDAGVDKEDIVVEIGAGAGTLTASLAEKCKHVYCFEVDERLRPILNKTLADYNNVTLNFVDVLKMKDEDFLKIVDKPFKLVANLPYYVTTPLIMRFLESDLPVESMTVTIQKEVAERITAKAGTAEYGSITVATDFAGYAKITRFIGKEMFFPVPKVDSALLRLDIVKNKYQVSSQKLFKKVVKCAFLWRRKTLANNLQSMFGLQKKDCEELLLSLGFSPMIRGEKLDTKEFISLTNALKDKFNL